MSRDTDITVPAIRVRRLQARYGSTQVLEEIECVWPRRGCVGVLGRNGAGKTSLLRAALGQGILTDGSIEIFGEEAIDLPTHRRIAMGIGYAPQERDVFPRLTVRENLRVGALRRGRSPEFGSVLQQFPRLSTRLDQPAGTLSGGERKMLAIARALLQEPRILLLDEPTEGIWHTVVDEIAQVIATLSSSLLVVLVEQHMELVFKVADQCLVLDRGRIALSGDAKQIRDHPELGALLAP